MAIDIKEILANGLIALSETVPLESVTVKQLLEHTGVSRQTFYNHFLDKNDLIQYIYLHKTIPDFSASGAVLNFHDSLLDSFYQMQKYQGFLKQACLMDGQNCLKDFIFQHCHDFDLKWHQERYGSEPMPETLCFATEYHANASSSMVLSWILSDMPASCEEMADLITGLRSVGMEKLFENGKIKGNPYQ